MDLSSLLGALLSSDSVSGMSQATNVSGSNVQNILGAALPTLLNGALQQSQNSGTAQGFANALTQHSAADTTNLQSFMGQVDMEDGAKILGHLFGSNQTNIVNQIAQTAGVSKKDTSSVLSAAAPLLMSLLGQGAQQQQQQNSSLGVADIMGSLLGSGNMTSLLTGLLGAGQPQQQNTANGLLGMLGKLFK